jgi:hypothetical protein
MFFFTKHKKMESIFLKEWINVLHHYGFTTMSVKLKKHIIILDRLISI